MKLGHAGTIQSFSYIQYSVGIYLNLLVMISVRIIILLTLTVLAIAFALTAPVADAPDYQSILLGLSFLF